MKIILIILAVATLTACSSLLYYPTKVRHTDPANFKHKPEDVLITLGNGLKLHGWYFHAPTRPAKATILMFHGNAQNVSTHFYSLYWSLDQGFDYFIFDYQGYGVSQGVPSPQKTVEDGRAALDWLIAHRDPHGPLIIFGQSLGGAVALRVACENHDKYDKVVVDSTFHSYRKVAQSALSQQWFTWPLQWIGWLVMSDAYAPKDCIQNISPKPLLVVHGTVDRTVAHELGRKVFELAAEPKEFWSVEGGSHTEFLFKPEDGYQTRLKEWMLK